eukprot:scaffold99267_cov28-Cyclotella_meneghiniana.AAC.1
MTTQKQQHLNHQPTLYHQLGSMANLQSFLMGNLNLPKPFNNDQVMAMKAAALSGLMQRNDNLNNSVASLKNNHTASNLNNLMALSNGSASSLMANSHSSKPFSGQIMATMASARHQSAPMILNCSTASMKNDSESSNLNSITALLNECASSRRSTEIALQMTEAESAVLNECASSRGSTEIALQMTEAESAVLNECASSRRSTEIALQMTEA